MRRIRGSILSLCLVALFLVGGGCSGGGGSPPDGFVGVPDGSAPPCSCTAGQRRCLGDQIQTCEAVSATCASWGPAVACPSGTCQGSSCGVACTDACPGGMGRCLGDGSHEVCRIGASGCLEWVKQACTAQQYCDTGQCAAVIPCDATCPAGYSCTPQGVCAGGKPDALALDVRTVKVSGSMTLNGVAPTAVATLCSATNNPTYGKAYVRLTENTQGYSFYLSAQCQDSGFAFSGSIFPGVYKVAVSGGSDTSNRPLTNLPTTYFVVDPALTLMADTTGKVLDVKTVKVSGSVTLNGVAPTAVASLCSATNNPTYGKAYVRLTENTQGYSFYLSAQCQDSGFAFSGSIFPGVYKVAVSGGSDTSNRPLTNLPTTYFVVDPALSLMADTTGKVLDVKTVKVAGSVTLNGVAPTPVAALCSLTNNPTYGKAYVRLTENTQGYSFYLSAQCQDTGFAFSGNIFPGTYSVAVSGGSDTSNRPLTNLPTTYFVVDPALSLKVDTTGKVLDVKTVRVAGSVTLNGVAPTPVASLCSMTNNPTYGKAYVRLTENTQGYSFYLSAQCQDTGFAFSGSIFPGVYKVAVSGGSDTSNRPLTNLPTTYFVVDPALTLMSDTTGKALDVKTVKVAGSVTLNGAAPIPVVSLCSVTNNPTYGKAYVRLTENTQGYSFYLSAQCQDSGFAFSGSIFPGVYKVAVSGGSDTSNRPLTDLPTTYFVVDPALTLMADTTGKVLDVKTVLVGGTVTLNGVEPTPVASLCSTTNNPTYGKMYVRLTENTQGYTFYLSAQCRDAGFTYSGSIFPGTYKVAVSGGSDTSNRPLTNLPTTYFVVIPRVKIL